ncbi:hypothetical protein ACHAQA_004727 [Verticillium albo-atrum]
MASQAPERKLTLYTYFRSSCSARVRTAALLKGIDLNYEYVNLLKGEQRSTAYTSELNASGTVPTLVIQDADGSTAVVRQSIAILEYLEEAFPNTRPLLPPGDQFIKRAWVRDLVNVISNDVQPKTNLSVLKRLQPLGVAAPDWCQEQMAPGFRAFESILKTTAGKYCVGDEITLADLVLAPAVEAALRWQVGMDEYPKMKRVYETLQVVPEVVRGDWKHQADTPESLRLS